MSNQTVHLTKYILDVSGHSAARLLARTGLKSVTPKRVLNRRWLHDITEQLIETASLRSSARRSISKILLALLPERLRDDLRSEPDSYHARQSNDQWRRHLADNYMRICCFKGVHRIAPSFFGR